MLYTYTLAPGEVAVECTYKILQLERDIQKDIRDPAEISGISYDQYRGSIPLECQLEHVILEHQNVAVDHSEAQA